MPLINGCKYSCEPCIRGHRATSCQHTDRILIEVRKPGRPLESCGHEFSTCQCGKVAALFSVGNAFDTSISNNMAPSYSMHPTMPMATSQEPTFYVDAQPVRQQKKKSVSEPKDLRSNQGKVRGQARVGKKARTGSETSSKSSPLMRSSRETSSSSSAPVSSKSESLGSRASNAASTVSTETIPGPEHTRILMGGTDMSIQNHNFSVLPQYPQSLSKTNDVIISFIAENGEAQNADQTAMSPYTTMTEDSVWRAVRKDSHQGLP